MSWTIAYICAIIVSPIVSLIGILANLLAFIVFSRAKFKDLSLTFYYKSLAIFDTIFLINNTIPPFSDQYLKINIETLSYFLCKTYSYFLYSLTPISAWTLVLIGFDRMISITNTKRFGFLKYKKVQFCLIILILIFNALYYLPMVFYKKYKLEINNSTKELVYTCTVETATGKVLTWLDFINSAFLPFIIMIVLSIITIKSLHSTSEKLKIHIEKEDFDDLDAAFKTKNRHFAASVIISNIIFCLLNFPLSIINLLLPWKIFDAHESQGIFYSTLVINALNFSSIFFINILFNLSFRREFFYMVSRIKRYVFKKDTY